MCWVMPEAYIVEAFLACTCYVLPVCNAYTLSDTFYFKGKHNYTVNNMDTIQPQTSTSSHCANIRVSHTVWYCICFIIVYMYIPLSQYLKSMCAFVGGGGGGREWMHQWVLTLKILQDRKVHFRMGPSYIHKWRVSSSNYIREVCPVF